MDAYHKTEQDARELASHHSRGLVAHGRQSTHCRDVHVEEGELGASAEAIARSGQCLVTTSGCCDVHVKEGELGAATVVVGLKQK